VDIYPIFIDARPNYLRDGPASSLLLVPTPSGTLLSYLQARCRTLTAHPPLVLTTFDVEGDYVRAVMAACPSVAAVLSRAELATGLSAYEPSDQLFFVDPRCFPIDGLHPQELLRYSLTDPRWARHLVSLDLTAGGTKERLDIDQAGNVRRIRRYYDSVTWPFTSGVACSLVPAASTLLPEEFRFDSLEELRNVLAARGVPSRDLPLGSIALDLTDERGLLALTEILVLSAARERAPGQTVLLGEGHDIHPTARLMGPVVLHGGVTVEEDATVLGPSLIGPAARIGAGAVVAQSLVAGTTQVPANFVVRHRALFGGLPAAPPPFREPEAAAYRDLLGQPLQEDEPRRSTWYPRIKALLDATVAIVALVVLSPLLALIALFVKVGSRGPILYGDKREGKDGRVFHCWKFRTMSSEAAARQRELSASNQLDGPQFKLEDDPRVTRVGRWLRPTSLDELPQLINVAVGQMSLVGPRPSPFRENQLCVPWREGRLSVRPGITGLWQVCRHDRASGDFHQWIHYDLLYVRHMSPWLDVKIIWATIVTLGGKRHVPLSRMLGKPAARAARAA
jgi:lipopolysaccharide/colanic/teichoic acid biosynthesis glycosyltransferase